MENKKENDLWVDLDQVIEDQLNLQVKIAYGQHHQFMLDHGLMDCKKVVDIGTGNGLFLRTLAKDHPETMFVGLDKRQYFVDRCNALPMNNVSTYLIDLQDDHDVFSFQSFDGVVMRYFLLHVPNAKEILKNLQSKMKKGTKLWIMDVDLSEFRCQPSHPTFDKLTSLINGFCEKNSIDTHAGQKLKSLFDELGFKNVVRTSAPFSTEISSVDDMVKFMKQETICYSRLSGRPEEDAETKEIMDFVETAVRQKELDIRYGMILWYAEM